MVGLAIVSILMFLAIPAMTSWLRNARVRTIAEALQNDLRSAQAQAVRSGHRTVFVLTSAAPVVWATPSVTGTNWYAQLLPLTGSNETTATITTPLLTSGVAAQASVSLSLNKSFVYSSATNITGTQADSGMVCFSSAGRLSSTAAPTLGTCAMGTTEVAPLSFIVTMQGSDKPLVVQVQAGGRVRICDPAKTLSSTQPDGC